MFIADPMVLSARIDLGRLGDTYIFGLSSRFGLLINRFDLGVGYELLYIGDEEIGGASVSVRVWF